MFGLKSTLIADFYFFHLFFLFLFPFFLPALRLNEYCLLFHVISLIDVIYTTFGNIFLVDPAFTVYIFTELESVLNYYTASPVVYGPKTVYSKFLPSIPFSAIVVT